MLEKLHIKNVANLNYSLDKFLKFSTLCLSTVTTYFVAIETDISVLNRVLSFSTTLLSGCHTIFNNSEKGNEHHKLSRTYGSLKEEIDTHVRNAEYSHDVYEECNKKFISIHENSMGLFPHIRKKHINE